MDRCDFNLPNFCEDPTFYEDDIIVYLKKLEQFDPTTLDSTRKPSLSDYDLHDDEDVEDEEVRECYRSRRLG